MAFWVSRKEGATHKGFPGCSTKRWKKLNKRSKNLGMLDGSLVTNRKCDHKVNQVLFLITSLQEQHNQLLWHLQQILPPSHLCLNQLNCNCQSAFTGDLHTYNLSGDQQSIYIFQKYSLGSGNYLGTSFNFNFKWTPVHPFS